MHDVFPEYDVKIVILFPYFNNVLVGSDIYSDDEDIHNYRNNPEVYKAFFEGIVDPEELSGSGDYGDLMVYPPIPDQPIKEHSNNNYGITRL